MTDDKYDKSGSKNNNSSVIITIKVIKKKINKKEDNKKAGRLKNCENLSLILFGSSLFLK